ncbi:hypothetical protein KUTeg_003626 [Tegillarca granosa]|uniref:Uncharacterized protein n=1 Tax=Tegillarca granosa TaxID=220873 RepID=A0ABQ9FQJ1_TEGGR|nr:hypothetical protein KUTeg_003626 [Tegillarca granosa]
MRGRLGGAGTTKSVFSLFSQTASWILWKFGLGLGETFAVITFVSKSLVDFLVLLWTPNMIAVRQIYLTYDFNGGGGVVRWRKGGWGGMLIRKKYKGRYLNSYHTKHCLPCTRYLDVPFSCNFFLMFTEITKKRFKMISKN